MDTECVCGFCGKEIDFKDEYGYFYIMSPFILYAVVLLPCCEECYWKFGDTHRRLYGCGER